MAPSCTLSRLPLSLVVMGAICSFVASSASAALVIEGVLQATSQTTAVFAFCVFALSVTGLFSAAIEIFTRVQIFREAAGFENDTANAR